MIVYPDGRTLYWIEEYPNEIGKKRDQQIQVGTLELSKERILSQDGLLTGFDSDLWSERWIS